MIDGVWVAFLSLCCPSFMIWSPVFQIWGSNARELYPWQGMEVGWGSVSSVSLSVFFRTLAELPSPGKTQWMTIKKIRSKKLYDTKVLPLSLSGVIVTWVCW